MKQLIWFCVGMLYWNVSSAQLLDSIKRKYIEYNRHEIQEKVYAQTDRTFYKPGEEIWLNVFITNAENAPSTQSEFVYVEWYDARNVLLEKQTLLNKNGYAEGHIALAPNILGGVYTLRVYSYWQQNFGKAHYFEKKITIQHVAVPNVLMKMDFEREAYGAGDEVVAILEARSSSNVPLVNHPLTYTVQLAGKTWSTKATKTNREGVALLKYSLPQRLSTSDNLVHVQLEHNGQKESIAQTAPILLGNLDLQLLPEGGNLIAGYPNRVAVKVLNELGKPADIKAEIVTKKGEVVQEFETFHQGMGAFVLSPKKGEQYRLRVLQPQGIHQQWTLPAVDEHKLGIYLKELDDHSMHFDVYGFNEESFVLMVQQQGKIVYSKNLQLKNGVNTLELPTHNLPMGIVQITIIDQQQQIHVERLCFVNKHRKLEVNIQSNKKAYHPREKVVLDIAVKDETGKGVQGQFSMAVVDDKEWTFADDKQDNILSYLLMSSELKGEVHEPNFYFDPKEAKAAQALDYVMLTHGWRRFDWATMLTDTALLVLKYPIEKNIAGHLKIGDQWAKNHTIFLAEKQARYTKKKALATTQTDQNGFFQFSDIAVNFPAYLCANYHGEYHAIPIYEYSQQVETAKIRANNNEPQLLEQKVIDPIQDKKVLFSIEKELLGDNSDLYTEEQFQDMKEYIKDELKKRKLTTIDIGKKDVLTSTTAGLDQRLASSLDETVFSSNRYHVNAQAEEAKIASLHLKQLNPKHLAYVNVPKFYKPVYKSHKVAAQRNDFRKTIHWQPNIQTNETGKAKLSYYNSDAITTFRVILEGNSSTGNVAHQEYTYHTTLPFSMTSKLPTVLSYGDTIQIPVVFTNNSGKDLKGTFSVKTPPFLKSLQQTTSHVAIPAQEQQVQSLKYKVAFEAGEGTIDLAFEALHLKDRVQHAVQSSPKGFPTYFAMSGQELTQTDSFIIDKPYKGSLEAKLSLYPDLLEGLMDGVEQLLSKPSGCFEQVSSSNYPNVLALDLMQKRGTIKASIRQKALAYLKKGYAQLAAYEIAGGGFEWYGQAPAHEGLTAYGLVQLHDMKKVYAGVDTDLIERTKTYLLSRKNGAGGFEQNVGKYGFKGNKPALFNAYITWALSEVHARGIQKEIEAMTKEALESEDLYRMSLAALTHFNVDNLERAERLVKSIQSSIYKIGLSKVSAESSLTYSYGKALNLETLSFAALAMVASQNRDEYLLVKIIKYLSSQRQQGGFGSTQSTIMVLKAMCAYAKTVGKAKEAGQVVLLVNNQLAKTYAYTKDIPQKIQFKDLETYFVEGKNTVQLTFENTSIALPYTLDVAWTSETPKQHADCPLVLTTHLSKESINLGEPLRLNLTLENKQDQSLASPMAVIGIPAGLSVQAWQLNALQEKEAFAFYELKDNYLILYYREMKPKEVVNLALDLKTELSGTYQAPSSSAYLYYGEEYKYWTRGLKIKIGT